MILLLCPVKADQHCNEGMEERESKDPQKGSITMAARESTLGKKGSKGMRALIRNDSVAASMS